jgi:hypothetical protein
VFVECAEKTGFRDFRFFRQGNKPALRGRRRLPEKKCTSRDQRMAAESILTVLESPKWKSVFEASGRLTPEEVAIQLQYGVRCDLIYSARIAPS